MVIDKTSQCGAESRAVTSLGCTEAGWEEYEAPQLKNSTCSCSDGCKGSNCHTQDRKSKRREDNE